MEEVWENEYYQKVLDEEVNVLKRMYKQWEDGKRGREQENDNK